MSDPIRHQSRWNSRFRSTTSAPLPSQEQMAARTAADAASLLEQTEQALKGVETAYMANPAPFKLAELVGEGGHPTRHSPWTCCNDVDLDLKN